MGLDCFPGDLAFIHKFAESVIPELFRRLVHKKGIGGKAGGHYGVCSIEPDGEGEIPDEASVVLESAFFQDLCHMAGQ